MDGAGGETTHTTTTVKPFLLSLEERVYTPWFPFSDPKVRGFALFSPEPNVGLVSTDELVAQRLEARQEERRRGWEVGDGEGKVRDRHDC